MPRFRYVAMDAKGKESEGVLDAASQSEAVSFIRAKGFFPTKVAELGADGSPQRKTQAAAKVQSQRAGKGLQMEIKLPAFLSFFNRVKPKQLMVFTRQLATLVDAGLPLLRGLRILLQQEKNSALRDALNGIGESVEGGSTFSEALAMHSRIFDPLFINMVKAGEAGGILEVVLTRLADFMEKTERIKRKVKSAMVYPVVVLLASTAIVAFMLVKVIPQFANIFQDLLQGKALPKLTQFVINISNLIRFKGLYVLGAIVLMVVAVKLLRRTKSGHYALDKLRLKLPLFGQLFLKTAVARFSRTLGILMSAGVPVLQALNIVKETSGNSVIEAAIQNIHDSVKEGDTMTMPMEASGVFPAMVVSMVDVGEETGALPEMLIRIGDNYDEEVDAAVEGLTSIIEPVMIIFLALIIGTIVIAMFVPLISIITTMAGG